MIFKGETKFIDGCHPQRISEEMRNAHNIIAMTGAGVSVASGIPPFTLQSPMWQKYDFQKADLLSYFEKDPSYHWLMAIAFIKSMLIAMPNAAHSVLANFEKQGKLNAIVTTNVDHLHQEAGSKNVVEFHGTFYTSSCLKCGERATSYSCVKDLLHYPENELEDLLKRGQKIPRCRVCNEILKADIPFFDQGLAIENAFKVERLAIQADLMLVIGTSLQMGPIGLLPNIVKANNGKVVIINPSETTFDKKADLICRDKSEIVLPKIEKSLLEDL
jgi:NAD-dependent deacetylase